MSNQHPNTPLDVAEIEPVSTRLLDKLEMQLRYAHEDADIDSVSMKPIEGLRLIVTIRQQAAELAALRAQLPRVVEARRHIRNVVEMIQEAPNSFNGHTMHPSGSKVIHLTEGTLNYNRILQANEVLAQVESEREKAL